MRPFNQLFNCKPHPKQKWKMNTTFTLVQPWEEPSQTIQTTNPNQPNLDYIIYKTLSKGYMLGYNSGAKEKSKKKKGKNRQINNSITTSTSHNHQVSTSQILDSFDPLSPSKSCYKIWSTRAKNGEYFEFLRTQNPFFFFFWLVMIFFLPRLNLEVQFCLQKKCNNSIIHPLQIINVLKAK